jgi:hypothetical protein
MRIPADAKIDALVRLYTEANASLTALVEGAVEATGTATATGRYYKAQRARVRELLGDLQATAIPQATMVVSGAYVNGALAAEKVLNINGGFAGVHTEAVEVLADNMVNSLNDAARTVGRRADDVFRKQALNDISRGLIEGSTRVEVSNAMRNNLVREGATAFTDKAGRRWALDSYAKMAVRTTTREAVSQGSANRMLENGQDLITISEHSDTDPTCADYAGNTYSLTGATSGYEVIDQLPPFHPNCEHVSTPAGANLDAFEAALFATSNDAFGSVTT